MATTIHAEEASARSSTWEPFFDAVVRVETRLYNALDARLRAEHGIAASQFEFMRHLAAHPRARVADLAQAFAVGVGATSKSIDRLQARGWVTRVANPDDRRSSLLELTEAGVDLVTAAQATFRSALDDACGSVVTGSELSEANSVLQRIRTALEERRVGNPVG